MSGPSETPVVRLTTMAELARGRGPSRWVWRRRQLSVLAPQQWRGHSTYRAGTWGELARWNWDALRSAVRRLMRPNGA